MSLHTAYTNNDVIGFKRILDEMKDHSRLNYATEQNRTILWHICNTINEVTHIFLELVLKCGVDPNVLNASRHHILSCIYNNQFRNIRVFELLLEYGANINFMQTSGKPLHDVCLNADTFANGYMAVLLAMKYGAKNDFIQKHWALGSMRTIDVCRMLISPNASANGFRNSANYQITTDVINLLAGYKPNGVSYQTVRQNKMQVVNIEKQAQQAELEKQRLADLEKQRLADLERQRLADLEKQRRAIIEQQRLDNLERQRLADLEKQRLADLEKQRLAEQQRLDELEKQKLAEQQAEIERQLEIERLRLLEELTLHEEQKSESEALSLLALAIKNLEYLAGNDVPDNLRAVITNMTSQLLIKAGQKMPAATMNKLNIPDEYKHLINCKDVIQPFWE